jgi:hypothetical protein
MIPEFLINKAYAQTGCSGSAICNPLGSSGINDFGTLIQCVIVYFTKYIAPPIVVIAILYGAFVMLTAGGEPEKFSTGRKIILYAIIGYVVVLVATGLVSVVLSVLGAGAAATTTCPLF